MFYYAEINSDYLVINTHSLAEASTNANYIAITEEQYTDGDLIDKYYNSLTGVFEVMADGDATAPSDWITYGETSMILTTKVDNMQVEINNLANGNSGGVSQDDLQVLEDMISTKADANHSHTAYALVDHIHDDYATQTSLDVLSEEVDGKANAAHSHSEYALTSHEHDNYAASNHDHDTVYATLSHSHSNYVTATDFDVLEAVVNGKAEVGHTHSNYSETTHNHDTDYSPISHTHTASEVGAATSGHNHDTDYADINHNHDSAYASVGHDHDEEYATVDHVHANYATVTSVNELTATVSNKANATDLTSHTGNTTIHITDAERESWNAKSNFSGNYNDLTNKPTIPSINGLATEVYVDEKVNGITVESIGAMPNTTVIPTVPTNVSAFNNDAGYLTEHQSLNGYATETYVDTQINALVIPDALSDLTADSTHRTVTDAEKATWNAKSNFSGSYNDLTNKPSIPSISGLATETYVDEAVSAKADAGHNHNDIYYTETEIDTLLSNKSNSNHNHNSSYDALGTAETKANAVQSNLDVVSEDLAEHIDNADIHFTTAERTKLSGIAANANNYTHPNSGVTAGTYKSVTVNAQGHITSGANPTTLAGYGITDAETKGAAASALTSANAYTDTAIDTLSETVSDKANASDLTSHTGNTTVHIISTERTNWNSAKTHADSAHAPANAEENQNAFSNVVVNGTTISADTKTDTLTFVAGNNVTITPDATGDSITISSANTVYTHPTSSGNKHIPAGGSSGQILRWGADGTAVWGNDNNTTYSNATQTVSGLMSNTDKTKLDGIAEGANNYTLPSAGTSLGGVKSGGDVTISGGVITVNDDSHNHVISNIDGLQGILDGKASSSHTHSDVYTETEVDSLLSGKANASHTHTIANITNLQSTLDGKAATNHGTHVSYSTTAPVMDGTASVGTASTVARSDHKHPTDTSRAAQTSLDSHTGNKSNPHGVTLAQLGLTATAAELNALDGITATVTELNYVDGVTSNIQTQLNGKAASSHAHTIANITNLQTTLDGKAASSHTHKVANISDLTATATELNYVDGVTSNIQTQLDGKAASSHNHAASNITSGTLSSDRLPTVPISKGGTGATTAAGALTNLGITATASELNKLDGVTATTAELNYVDGVTSNIQTQLNGKAASSHTHNTLSVQSDNYKQGTDLPSTYPRGETIFFSNNPTNKFNGMSYCTIHTIKGYNNMVCIQFAYPYNTNADTIYYRTALYNTDVWREWKTISVSDHTHNYAGSSSAGGAATSANKLNTNAGDANTPVYFANGVPVACTSLDLNTTGNAATATNVAWSGVTSKPSYYDAKAIKSITRSGTTFTYTCMDGTTGTFTQQDNNTTYGAVTTSANGLMTASDKAKLDGMVLATVSEVETYLGI